MAYLYNEGLKIVGNKDRSIIEPNPTPPTEGSWRRRVEGTGESSTLVYEKYVSGVWEVKQVIS